MSEVSMFFVLVTFTAFIKKILDYLEDETK